MVVFEGVLALPLSAGLEANDGCKQKNQKDKPVNYSFLFAQECAGHGDGNRNGKPDEGDGGDEVHGCQSLDFRLCTNAAKCSLSFCFTKAMLDSSDLKSSFCRDFCKVHP